MKNEASRERRVVLYFCVADVPGLACLLSCLKNTDGISKPLDALFGIRYRCIPALSYVLNLRHLFALFFVGMSIILSMSSPNYSQWLDSLFARMAEIMRQRSDLDAESAKLTQLMHAAVNMLPDNQRNEILDKWTQTFTAQLGREFSLVDSVRKVMQEAGRQQWLTVAQVRDRLIASGFDFSGYMSNPLASVSATLIRMKDKREVDSNAVEGVTVYRAKINRMAAAFAREKARTLSERIEDFQKAVSKKN